VNELRADPHAVACFAHAALEDRRHVELLRHGRDVHFRALEAERRGSRRHAQAANLRQHVEQLFRQAVGEVFVGHVVTHVDEGQNGNRRLVRNIGDRPFEQLCRVRQGAGPDLRRKAVASAGDGGNGAVTEDLAQCRHLHLQVVLLDDQSRPRKFEQFVLGDQPLASLDESSQNIECSRAQRRRLIVDQELSRRRAELKAAEFVVCRHYGRCGS